MAGDLYDVAATMRAVDISITGELVAEARSVGLETYGGAADEADAILNAVDIILHGTPIGRPR